MHSSTIYKRSVVVILMYSEAIICYLLCHGFERMVLIGFCRRLKYCTEFRPSVMEASYLLSENTPNCWRYFVPAVDEQILLFCHRLP